jgi:molybdopterin converting factor subunit 1
MNVAVKLFAAARDLAGAPQAVIDASPGVTVGDVRRCLAAQHPQLAPLAARSLLAVNAEYVSDATTLSAGDEVALIPPVSGG